MAKKTARKKTVRKNAQATPRAQAGRPIPSSNALFRRPTGGRRSKLSDSALARAEKKLGVTLPKAYTDLLREQNGGELRFNAIKSKRRPPAWHTDRPVYEFNRIVGVRPGHESILDYSETARGWDLPALTFPIDGDGHWWLCLDYRKCAPDGEPFVTHIDLEDDRPRSFRVADTFQDLLRGLRFEAGGDAVLSIEDPDLLDGGLADGLRKLGWRVEKHQGDKAKGPPRAWRHKQFASIVTGDKASLLRWPNGDPEPWHLARPARHPLLLLSVSAKDQDPCVRALREAFGNGLALIHIPIDRRPPRGVPVEETPLDAKPKRSRTQRTGGAKTSAAKKTGSKATPAEKPEPTALNAAVIARDVRRIKHLLELGMSPDKPCVPGGSSGLSTAAACATPAIFKLLWDASKGRASAGLLSGVVSRGWLDWVQVLIDAGAKPATGHLERAAWHGHTRVVELLIDLGIKPRATHMESAAMNNQTRVVKLLVDRGIKPNEKCLRIAAGVECQFLTDVPTEPNQPMMRLMKNEGLRARDPNLRERFEALK